MATGVPLAELRVEDEGLSVLVIDARRLAPSIAELTLVFAHSGGAGPVDLAARLPASADGRGSLEESFISDPERQRKFFVLRDGDDTPLCSRDLTELSAGERRVAWVRFGAVPGDLDHVDVHVPGIGTLERVALAPEPSTPGSRDKAPSIGQE